MTLNSLVHRRVLLYCNGDLDINCSKCHSFLFGNVVGKFAKIRQMILFRILATGLVPFVMGFSIFHLVEYEEIRQIVSFA